MNLSCLVCTHQLQYASPYYRHATSSEYVPYATCRPPVPAGKAVCWNCGISEGDVATNPCYHHDFMGWGKFTCPTPKRLERCLVCREPKCVGIPSYYAHAYAPEDRHKATCLPPQPVGQRKCWACGINEQSVSTPDEFARHDFTGWRFSQSMCLGHGKPNNYYAKCPNCQKPVSSTDDHEDSFGDGMGCGAHGYKCSKAN